jgi:hypothetical protein
MSRNLRTSGTGNVFRARGVDISAGGDNKTVSIIGPYASVATLKTEITRAKRYGIQAKSLLWVIEEASYWSIIEAIEPARADD